MNKPLAYIFDLDGTLLDSLRDVAEALNDSLELLGLATRPVNDYRYLVGEGIPTLCQRLLGDSQPHYLNRLAELARAHYRTRPLRHTKPYAGIPSVIRRLREHGVRLAVLSNKPHELTQICVEAYWPGSEFDRVYGYTHEAMRKPDPGIALRICDELGVRAANACLVGDTPTDVQTARNAGMRCIAVTWGFRPRAELVASGATELIDDPADLA